MDDLRKPWLGPLAILSTFVLVLAFGGLVASMFYVVQKPAQTAGTQINPFSGRIMTPKVNKFKTEPLAWAAVGFGILGLGAGIAREWARRERRRIETALERLGIFPPPSRGLFQRIFRGG